jgi:hypothetical protein
MQCVAQLLAGNPFGDLGARRLVDVVINKNKTLKIRSKEDNEHHLVEAFRRCKFKFPGRQLIIRSKKHGFTKLNREDYQQKKEEELLIADGVSCKVCVPAK